MSVPRVLIVDDSAVARETLTAVLEHGGMTVTSAADPIIAFRKIARKRPDVIVLDLEMPRMTGLEFLSSIMRTDPIPVVVCSALAGGKAALDALSQGAIDIIAKPRVGVRDFINESAITIIDTVRAAAAASVRIAPSNALRSKVPVKFAAGQSSARRSCGGVTWKGAVIAIGASTGGPDAIARVLSEIPADGPSIVIVQHMPAGFTTAFARRLDGLCALRVREAEEGDRLEPGLALLAPGDRHVSVHALGDGFRVKLDGGPLVSRHRPSINVLFSSMAKAVGPRAVGALLTGMGSDGATGLLEMRGAGAATFAQDEATSVVFGMARQALVLGGVQSLLPLPRIGPAILRAAAGSASDPGTSR